MGNWKTKGIAILMAFVMFFSITASSAQALSLDDAQSSTAPSSLTIVDRAIYYAYLTYFASQKQTGDVQNYGWRGAIVKGACEFIAWLIRKGVSNDEVMERITKNFDKAAADTLKSNSYKIANELERLGEIPDVTTHVVKEKLINFMKHTLKINGGTAQLIGEGIAAGINFLVF